MSISTTYRANGKLLLTGEYLILHGAKAIALPLKAGQQLRFSEGTSSDSITWHAYYNNEVWFSCELNPTDFSVMETNHPGRAETIRKIFKTIRLLNPDFQPKAGTSFETVLDADPGWGFGSSSTLISLLAQWSGVDPFVLNERIFNGSGFDIACATADGPIFYTKNVPAQPVFLDYPFAEQLFLVYSGQKRETFSEVSIFLKEKKVTSQLIDEVSALSDQLALCFEQDDFNRIIRQHEKLVGNLIGKNPVKSAFFQDFGGEIKSLGAWGGDFYLVSTSLSFSGVKKYFENKGLTIIFRWNELILKR